MPQIYQYSVAVLIGVALFGAILGLMRLFYTRRLRDAQSVIRKLEGAAARDLAAKDLPEKELGEEQALASRPALYGIPYLAWIMTALVIPAAFLILFFENLVSPYQPPLIGKEARITYRAPTSFSAQGQSFARHEILVPSGKLVTASDRSLILQALRERTHVGQGRIVGTLLIVTVFIVILIYHINILYPTSIEKNKNLILIYLTVLLVLVCAKVSLLYDLFSPYLIPVPFAGMIITILINRRIVPLTMLITLILVFLGAQFDFGLFLVLLSGGLVTGSWMRYARRRSELMWASFLVGLVMLLVFCCESILSRGDLSFSFPGALASLSNGVVSGLLTLIFLPLFELVFDFASPFRLMELLDLNTPVLKEFFFKAPGSYQHSMGVANIAESVANEIGVNSLLVRVGAYYHDIGKMFSPQYFIENQMEGPDLHNALGPVASAAVIRSHVILGVRLARQIGLPTAVVDFISEHHGTSTIDYFYYKSKQLESEIKSERIFKHPGPKPRSKETAIVMIVDSVEAAFRVVKERDEESIRQLVNRIAERKLEQGELDQSRLTVGELKKIVNVLTHILKSSSHQRIAYPSDQESELKPASSLRVVSGRGSPEDRP